VEHQALGICSSCSTSTIHPFLPIDQTYHLGLRHEQQEPVVAVFPIDFNDMTGIDMTGIGSSMAMPCWAMLRNQGW
jgi:hypothetical protein